MATDDQDSTTRAAAALNKQYPCLLSYADPPMDLIDGVQEAIAHLDEVGFPYSTIDRLSRFEREIYDGSHLKTFAGNKRLVWVETNKELKQAILESLPFEGFTCSDVWTHLGLFHKELKNRPRNVTRSSKLSDENLIEKGWVFLHKHLRIEYLDSRGTTYDYEIMGENWAKFFVALKQLELVISDLPRRCRAEGRVLTISESSLGKRLVHPNDWRDQQFKLKKDVQSQSVLTGNLPDDWAFPNLGPRKIEERKKKRDVLKWLNDLYLELHPTGKKPRKDDVLEEIERRFDITSSEFQNEIWREAKIIGWKKSGAIRLENSYTFDA